MPPPPPAAPEPDWNATDIPTRADADARYAPISDLDIGRQFALTAVCPI